MRKICTFTALAALIVLAACSQTPLGPPNSDDTALVPLRGSWGTLEAGGGIWIDPHGVGDPGVPGAGPDDDGGDPATERGGGAIGSGN